MLEMFQHDRCAFITLTYRDEDIPYENGFPTLQKRDAQLFLKRLRKQFGLGIRYYLCGEYGEKTGRPHYHAILFGLGPDDCDPEWLLFGGQSGFRRASPLSRLWRHGIVHVGSVSRHSIQYVAGYVTKKITKKGDARLPEFALMSRRPGIAADAIPAITAALKDVAESQFTGQLRIDGKKWPMGRYLLTKLSDVMGYSSRRDQFIQEMTKMFVESRSSGMSFLEFMVSRDDQKFKQLEKRDKMFNHRDFEVL